jgi:serine/threonine protein kinase
MEEHSRKPLSVGHVIGGYGIVRVIGQGGFGIVYEAVNAITRERVAIKQFYPNSIASWREGTIVVIREDDQEKVEKILKRFQDEATLQHNFNHPNILKVKNFIPADNTGYMISEYIDGKTLIESLKPYGAFPSEEKFRHAMEPILSAVSYVHEKQILHRDISPDNIMIDSFGKTTLVDFGAAKLDLRQIPSTRSIVLYRDEYAPIEQRLRSNERLEGYYTDIFALAGTMYRVLAGEPPVNAFERSATSKDPYVPIARTSKVKCSKAVYDAIDRGLAMDEKARPATIEEFTELLGWRGDAKQQDSPPPPPPPTPPLPPPPPNRWKSYALVLLLIAGVIGVLYFLSNTDDQTASESAPSPPSLPTVPPTATATPTQSTPSPPSPPIIRPVPPAPDPKIAQEPTLYQSALDCIRNSISCNPDACLTPYRSSIGFGDRYSSLRAEYDKIIQSPRCSQPTSQPPIIAAPTIAPRPTYVPPPPTYVTYENRDVDGGDLPGALPHLRDVDQQACASACDTTTGCIGYSYGKWDRACYLKQSFPDLRFEPNSTAALQSGQLVPPSFSAARKIEKTSRTFAGNRYSTSPASSRVSCSVICEREEACLGYQFTGGACWRYDRIDFATKDPSAQSGVKRQPAP